MNEEHLRSLMKRNPSMFGPRRPLREEEPPSSGVAAKLGPPRPTLSGGAAAKPPSKLTR